MTNDEQAIFSQLDSRWARITLGYSPYTIKDWGCTITAISRICYLLTGKIKTPGELAKLLDFNGNGELYWASVKKIGLSASVTRSRPSLETLKNNAKRMIIKLNYSPNHWVAVDRVDSENGIITVDPLIKGGGTNIKSRSEILTYTIFEAIEKPAPIDPDPVPNWPNVVGNKSAKDIWNISKEKGYVSKNTKFQEPKNAGEMLIYLARIFPEKFN